MGSAFRTAAVTGLASKPLQRPKLRAGRQAGVARAAQASPTLLASRRRWKIIHQLPTSPGPALPGPGSPAGRGTFSRQHREADPGVTELHEGQGAVLQPLPGQQNVLGAHVAVHQVLVLLGKRGDKEGQERRNAGETKPPRRSRPPPSVPSLPLSSSLRTKLEPGGKSRAWGLPSAAHAFLSCWPEAQQAEEAASSSSSSSSPSQPHSPQLKLRSSSSVLGPHKSAQLHDRGRRERFLC